MKRTWQMVWMWYAISTWLWWSTSTFGSSLDQYPLLSFSIIEATNETYHHFILALRDHLINGEDTRHGIPVMRNNASVRMSDRFVLVELENYRSETVTLAINVINAYVVGYRAQNDAYFLRPDNNFDAHANDYLFTDIPNLRRYTLPFDSVYTHIEDYASVSRGNLPLGLEPLHFAIDSLYNYPRGRSAPSTMARSILVSAQMISEAARFHSIEHEISEIIYAGRSIPLDASLITLENGWRTISSSVQTANPGGVFSSQIRLPRYGGGTYDVGYVWIVRSIIAIMLYTCQPPPPSYSQFPMLIKPVVPQYNDEVCENAEPTVRITGPNGFCVEVQDGNYSDGNTIQLSQCVSSFEVRQLWTLKGDGTIRSNGKCLSSSGDQPGDHVEIINCFVVETGRIKWQVWDNGTIINSKTGLAMTATPGTIGPALTVEPNDYTTSQSWLPSNETRPFVTSILGLNNLCLQTNERNIWLEKCAIGKAEQAWALYGDGSIRPRDDRYRCITCDTDSQKYNVRAFTCLQFYPGQRWMFKNDKTLWNMHYNMVMEVKDSDPSLKQIIISPFSGDSNQEWLLML